MVEGCSNNGSLRVDIPPVLIRPVQKDGVRLIKLMLQVRECGSLSLHRVPSVWREGNGITEHIMTTDTETLGIKPCLIIIWVMQ